MKKTSLNNNAEMQTRTGFVEFQDRQLSAVG